MRAGPIVHRPAAIADFFFGRDGQQDRRPFYCPGRAPASREDSPRSVGDDGDEPATSGTAKRQGSRKNAFRPVDDRRGPAFQVVDTRPLEPALGRPKAPQRANRHRRERSASLRSGSHDPRVRPKREQIRVRSPPRSSPLLHWIGTVTGSYRPVPGPRGRRVCPLEGIPTNGCSRPASQPRSPRAGKGRDAGNQPARGRAASESGSAPSASRRDRARTWPTGSPRGSETPSRSAYAPQPVIRTH
jgi:hypothetical protein